MIVLLSPAKTLDFETALKSNQHSLPINIEQASQLIGGLKKMSVKKIGELMHLSEILSALNHQRYQHFTKEHHLKNARPAVFTFSGEVANGLAADEFSDTEIDFAQKHIRILSGLYGLLKPLDLIQPYRLEMGTAWAPAKNKNLYTFWDTLIAEQINIDLNGSETVINLASAEYFKAVQQKVLKANVIHCHFKEKKGKDYKIVMMFAKKARGRMAHYIVKNKIEKSTDLQKFKIDGYAFNKTLSTANDWVFTRG